ncbi:hypothetical protein TWF192_007717 [Orbilia oligospora]|uniref:Uncharacterized protein n=1 Tax=Orbilia oligospora TaxID=2813651 RepID=A0A6G1M3L3_ORBOL|nr:hypothetical protein TWF679_007295 [Orbilia oligospora]KAF3227760.1 hypothetical protein TWF191_003280 [Orbilia oligospora]KAF3244425.1 hypothetical protein TWF192_007717 [Orbilia oligospora]
MVITQLLLVLPVYDVQMEDNSTSKKSLREQDSKKTHVRQPVILSSTMGGTGPKARQAGLTQTTEYLFRSV